MTGATGEGRPCLFFLSLANGSQPSARLAKEEVTWTAPSDGPVTV